jgi:thiamine-phosphate pyrophosphorylase
MKNAQHRTAAADPELRHEPRIRSGRESLQPFPVLYPILDAGLVLRSGSSVLGNRWSLLRRLVRELADSGVEVLQYRNKDDDDVLVAQDALAMREAAPLLRLILNDRAALVGPAGWNGLHVGQQDLSPSAVRTLVGRAALVGLSTHNDEQVVAAVSEPVDYIAVGPVFPTVSKSDTSPAIGLEGVTRARALTDKPLIAIGGITLENAPSVYDAGADSVAVISAIFASGQSPAHSAKDFLRIFK